MKNKQIILMATFLLILVTMLSLKETNLFSGFIYEPSADNRPAFEETKLHINKGNGETITLNTEIAISNIQKQYGLMFVRYLEEGSSMLFIYDRPRIISMWMRNTFIPLDMLFIGEDDCIVDIHQGATPHDLTPINSKSQADKVLEVNAGFVAKYDIAIGDCIAF